MSDWFSAEIHAAYKRRSLLQEAMQQRLVAEARVARRSASGAARWEPAFLKRLAWHTGNMLVAAGERLRSAAVEQRPYPLTG